MNNNFYGVFRKLQTPVAPLSGQALQGSAEIINIKTLHNNKSIEMNLTFSPEIGSLRMISGGVWSLHKTPIKNNNYYFTIGFLYVDEKEVLVHDFTTYVSLQIEDICHDNISVIRIPENLWS